MASTTLLTTVQQRFGLAIDPDSAGGRILGALTPDPPLAAAGSSGMAHAAPLTLVPTPGGVTVRAATPSDPLVLALPAGPLAFKIIPGAAGAPPRIELTIPSPALPAPFLRGAELNEDGTLRDGLGAVELHLPDLLVVVTGPDAHLAPSTTAGALRVEMVPPAAFVGPETVLGFSFSEARLDLEAPGGPEITVPNLEVYVAPPGIPALALRGGGNNLRFGMGPGKGLSGDFPLEAAGGAAAAARPRFVKSLAGHLRLDRGAVTLLELTGTIDLAGELAERIPGLGVGPSEISYRLGLTLDDGWRASLTLSASGGGDYLWRMQAAGGGHDLARDTLGAYTVFAPLLADPFATGSGYAGLTIDAAAAVALARAEVVDVRSVVVHGAELVMRQQGSVTDALLMFDVETELGFKAGIGGFELLSTKHPCKVRHKAIGLKLDFGTDGGAPKLDPVFDPARGFSLDLADPGLLTVPGPLGDIIEPKGARVAKENPLNLEIDLVLKADLGVVSVDRSTVRIPVHPAGPPTVTALGAHVDVPGALSGGGYLKLEPGGALTGKLDAALAPPIGVRASADLSIAHENGVDSVLVTLDVGLPVPIPIANSGLGLYGFLGLFGVHFERAQDDGSALDWFKDTAHGDATTPEAWRPRPDGWAFGVGAVIGTIEGGFLFNAKGMVILELPGPRVLVVMKANIMLPRPPVKGGDTGVLLAVIEIRPDSVTIGVIAEYAAQPLIELRAPAEAFFSFKDASDWHLDVGSLPPKLPVSVKFLFSLTADGYLMIHGNGIPQFPPHPLSGFSVAAGVHAALTWGPEPIGLYLRISAEAAVGISFKPMLILGTLAIRGELHLFIVSIEASADAKVVISEDEFFISARVCGSVDFFFFDVSGCVTLELGSEPSHLPPADPLVRALSLHARSRPMLHGSASDEGMDGSLGDATEDGHPDGDLEPVPIDAIPVLQFDMRAATAPGCRFLGSQVPSKLGPGQWMRRGARFYRYTVTSLDVSATQGGVAVPPVSAGDAPSVWWDRYGRPSGGDDNDVQLALLTWTPDPTPAAAQHTVSLDERVKSRWGTVCAEVARAAPVLWSFNPEPLGPSPDGWTLDGTPFPDDDGTVRSGAPATTARVTEPWRSGNPIGDALTTLTAGFVFGGGFDERRRRPAAGHLLIAPLTGVTPAPAVPDDESFGELLSTFASRSRERLGDAVRLDVGELASVRLLLFVNGGVPLDGTLTLRPLDEGGQPFADDIAITPDTAQQVSSEDALPWQWIDPDRPWWPTVHAAWATVDRLPGALLETYSLQLVTADLPGGTAQIEIGLVKDVEVQRASWGLLVFEAIQASELGRHDYDVEDRQRQIDTVNGYLGSDDGRRALLQPNAMYAVSLNYDVDVTGEDAHGNPDLKAVEQQHGRNQTFRFQTAGQPPERLDPWVLATDPSPAAEFFFYRDRPRVVFSTSAARSLFEQYGRHLEAVALAATGNHPDPVALFKDTAAIDPFVLTPFGAALTDAVADLDCIAAGASFFGHQRSTLEITLEPLTEYVLDIRPTKAGDAPTHPLFRRRFSTSRYGSFHELAQDVAGAPVSDRRVADAAPLLALSGEVADRVLEDALRAVRWGELTRSSVPRVSLVWRDPPPDGHHSTPVAVLLETPEPLWRRRESPTEVTDGHGVRRYELRPWQWLDVVETSPGPPLVARFVQTTDGARTLVILNDGVPASGADLLLTLRRTHHPLFEGDSASEVEGLRRISIPAAAPWDVTP